MEDHFNYFGALNILQLVDRQDLVDDISKGDWNCLPLVYGALSRAIIDESLEDNGSDMVDAYFDIIKIHMGVSCDKLEDIPKVLKKLKEFAEDDDKKTLNKLILVLEKDEYFEFIITASEIVNKGVVLSSLVHNCCDLVINSLQIISNDDSSDSE